MNKNPRFEHLMQYKWIKGQSGNIAGRPKSYLTILKEMGISKEVIAVMVAELIFMSYDEIDEIANSTTEPIIRTIIATAFRRANHRGEFKYIADWMRMLIGNPSQIPLNHPVKEHPEQGDL